MRRKRQLIILISVLCILWLGMMTVQAEESEVIASGNCRENLTWSLDKDGKLVISGQGDMDNYYYYESGSYESPWHSLREQIVSVEIQEGVTSVGEKAFYFCTNLIEVTLPESVTEIREFAFAYCNSLASITIPSGVTSIERFAFIGCKMLSVIRFEGDSPKLEDNSFSDIKVTVIYPGNNPTWEGTLLESCSGITMVSDTEGVLASGSCGENLLWTLDLDGVLHISGSGEMVDYGWSSWTPWKSYLNFITKVMLDDGVTYICEGAFANCVNMVEAVLPEGIETLGYAIFSNCKKLETVMIPESITTIESSVFSDCSSLEDIVIPNSVTTIGMGAFEGCTNLKSIQLPENVTTISEVLFRGCTSLESIYISENVESIDLSAFSGCESLKNISVDEENQFYSSENDCVLFDKEKTTLLLMPAGYEGTYEVPRSVIQIGMGAFVSCEGLTKVTIPVGITTIGGSAFYGCTNLNEVILPYSIKTIGNSLFTNCTSLTQVVIPEYVEYVGEYAFANTSMLQKVFFLGNEPSVLEDNKENIFEESNEEVTVYRLDNAKGWEEDTWCGAKVETWDYEVRGVQKCGQSGGQLITNDEHNLTYLREIDLLEHRCNEWKITKEATSEEEGILSGICIICGEEVQEAIPKRIEMDQKPKESSNYKAFELYNFSDVIRSHLYEEKNGGVVRVEVTDRQGWSNNTPILVEYYDEEYNYLYTIGIEQELPLYGGYYNDGENHYLIFGQSNPDESDEKEVLRIVKYTWDWRRVDDVRLYGSNITIPFDAGSLRVTHCRDMLYIHSSHQMYMTPDNKNHQANMFFAVFTPIMEFTTIETDLGGSVYVSHSFNQFVQIDGTDVVTVDHGDGYPRAIVLKRSNDFAGNAYRKNAEDAIEEVEVLKIYGEIGDNTTKLSLGGFEVSDSHYLIAGYSVVQDEAGWADGTRNVFVASVSKKDFSENGVTINWLTVDGGTCPQFVKINQDKYLLMWKENGDITYTFVDGAGNEISERYTFSVIEISECQPIVRQNRVIWYATVHSYPVFYEIDLNNPETVNSYEVEDIEEGIFGDVNGDQKIDTSDAQAIFNHFMGISALSDEMLKYADINGDGSIDTSDAQAAFNIFMGIL